MSIVDLASWCAQAGFVGQDQATAIAVALAAGADPAKAQGVFGIGGGGTGLQQAQQAFAQWSKNGWASFPTHQNGSWLFYLPGAAAAVIAAPAVAAVPNLVSGTVQSVANASGVGGLAETVDNTVGFFTNPRTWLRFAKIVTGLLLCAVAAAKLTVDTTISPLFDTANKAGDEVAFHASNVAGAAVRKS